MKELLNRNLSIGDMVYIVKLDKFGILVSTDSVYTEQFEVKLKLEDKVVKLDLVDTEVVEIKDKLSTLYHKDTISKIELKQRVQEPGDMFFYRKKNVSHDFVYVVYLGISNKIETYRKQSEYGKYLQEDDISKKRVYLHIPYYSSTKDWIEDMRKESLFSLREDLLCVCECSYSTRPLSRFDSYVTCLNIKNLPQSIQISVQSRKYFSGYDRINF